MNSKYYPTVVASAIIILLALPAFALAQEGASCVPNQFEGTVTVNGNPAPTGLIVKAMINGVEMKSTVTMDGKYGYAPYLMLVPDNDGNCENAAMVDFYVEGQPAGNHIFENGGITRFDLSATGVIYCGDGSCNNGETCSTCPADCGSCPTVGDDSGPSGGGGRGGGGGGYTPPACTPDWECSAWSQCINGIQSRTCTDLDSCNTEEGKPATQQACGIESVLPSGCTVGQTTCVGSDLFECDDQGEWNELETCENGCDKGTCITEEETQEAGFSITGLFLNPVMGYGFVLLIIALIAAMVWRVRKKPTASGKPMLQ